MQYVNTKGLILVRNTQNGIFASYLNDMSKYNSLDEIRKARLVYDNIAIWLRRTVVFGIS